MTRENGDRDHHNHSHADLELVDKLKPAKSLLNKLSKSSAEDVQEKFIELFGDKKALCEKLCTDPEQGIKNDGREVMARKQVFGENVLKRKKPMSYCQILITYAKDMIIILLLSLSFIVLIMQIVQIVLTNKSPNKTVSGENKHDQYVELVEPLIIIVVVLSVINITAFSDWRQIQDQERLQQQAADETGVNVCRSGQVVRIHAADVVVGDVVMLDYGNILPADGYCVSSQGLTVDESALTGESRPCNKSPDKDFVLLSLTHVIDGKGKMIVTAVGSKSQNGKISKMLGLLEPDSCNESEQIGDEIEGDIGVVAEDSPKDDDKKEDKDSSTESVSVLQMKQAALASILTKITIFIAVIVLIIRITIYFTGDDFKNLKDDGKGLKIASSILDAIQMAVTIIVVGVPEGILIATTLTATIAAKRMKKDNCIVQFISACETMGNATIICSDKTGTLTQNKMTVVKIFVDGDLYSISEVLQNDNLSSEFIQLLGDSVAFNTNVTSYIKVHEKDNDGGEGVKKSKQKDFTKKLIGEFNDEEVNENKESKYDQVGNKTDCALLGLCKDLNCDIQDKRSEMQKSVHKAYSFNSSRKCMASLAKNDDGSFTLYIKGASEVILGKSSSFLSKQCDKKNLADSDKADMIEHIILPLARNGLRTISIAYKKLDTIDEIDLDDENSLFQDLTLIAIVGIEDPVRHEVPFSIKSVAKSGVRVIMVTGDNIETATSIAKQCYIAGKDKNELLLTSKEFNKLIRNEEGDFDQNRFDRIISNLCVLARAQPEDKNILVRGIINSNGTGKKEVVAVTGDGTNDAPALKAADVGFAMGIQGTDMAKKSADIIIDDDNFHSIIKAMLWGRNMYDSITKFLQFQLSVNFSVLIIVIATVKETHYPFRPIPLLWLNLIMDTLASLSLATDWPHKEQLERKPNTRDQSLISLKMIRKILGHIIFQSALIITLFYLFDKYYPALIFGGSGELKGKDKELFRNTFIFNSFIMLTIFNEFNSRVIMGERNVFARIMMNKKFIIIWISTLVINSIIVIFVGEYIGLASLYGKLKVADIFWFLFLGLVIGSLSLVWEQILLSIVPNSSLERFEDSSIDNNGGAMRTLSIERPRLSVSRGLIRGKGRIQVQHTMANSGRDQSKILAAKSSKRFMRSLSAKEEIEP